MRKIVGVLLVAGACLGSALAQEKKVAGPGTAETLKQLEHEWTDALKAADTEKLGQILADDWTGLGYDGKMETKQSVMASLKSGASKVESFDFGPMSVKVLGSVAVVQGSDTEKSTTKGKDTSGKWVWTDVFVKRDGKWLAVRSQSAKLK